MLPATDPFGIGGYAHRRKLVNCQYSDTVVLVVVVESDENNTTTKWPGVKQLLPQIDL